MKIYTVQKELQNSKTSCLTYFDERPISLTNNPGGSYCLNLAAFSLSLTFNVYKYRLHRTLNLTVLSFFFMILTDFASFLLAVRRKSLISLISRAIFLLLLLWRQFLISVTICSLIFFICPH